MLLYSWSVLLSWRLRRLHGRRQLLERAGEIRDVLHRGLAQCVGEHARLRAIAAEQHDAGVEVVARRWRAAQAIGLDLVGWHIVRARQALFGKLVGRAAIEEHRGLIDLV